MLVLALALALFGTAVTALESDRDQPIELAADSVDIGAVDNTNSDQIVAGGGNNITIANSSATRVISLGGVAGGLALNDGEIAEISTTGTLIIGSSTAGAISSQTADFSGLGGVELRTGSTVMRGIGAVRIRAKIGLRNMAYNMTRYAMLAAP